jgi:hypothetical protein
MTVCDASYLLQIVVVAAVVVVATVRGSDKRIPTVKPAAGPGNVPESGEIDVLDELC